MSDIRCENCGNINIIEKDGIPTCSACGTKYPNLQLENVDFKVDLKNKEIKRLIETHGENPNDSILTEDEILQYAPHSDEALGIKFRRAKGFDKLKVSYSITFFVLFMLLMFSIPIIYYLLQ